MILKNLTLRNIHDNITKQTKWLFDVYFFLAQRKPLQLKTICVYVISLGNLYVYV